ncbi:MAG: hypothetical protein HKM04_04580 [Legionellales bacterium]|nr:hypothetical protein [Legionellales bacterium]
MYGKHQQGGFILAVAIIVLLIMTFIGISTLGTAPIEEKIAGDYQEANYAFQAADSVDREAEQFLSNLSDTSAFNNTGGLYQTGQAPNVFTSSTWTGGNTRSSTQTLTGVQTPQYFIELLGTFSSGSTSLNMYNYGQDPNTGSVTMFRIVVQATDSSGTSSTTIQSFYGVRF